MNTDNLSKKDSNLALFGIISRFLFWLIPTIVMALCVGWFAIWQGIEFTNYEWFYSDVSTIKATQYLLHNLWGIAVCTSPVWWLGSIALTAIILKPK